MQSKKLNLQRIVFIALALSLVLLYVPWWVEIFSDPAQQTGYDFMAFYAAGRSALEHTPAAAYDLAYIKTNEEKVLGFKIADQDTNFLVHPPLVLPILWLIARFEYMPAFYLWVVFLLVLYVLCAQMAVKLVQGVKGINKLALWSGTFLFFPLFISLLNGQTSALLLLGTLLWYYGLTHDSSQMAGLGLSLSLISPQIALVLAIPFFFNAAYRKVWWWFCLGGTVLAAFSVAMLGMTGVRNYINILSISATGEGYHTNEVAMVNLIGMVKRLHFDFDTATIRTVGWIGSLVGLMILCVVWGRASAITDKHISLAVIVAAFTSPHLHYHDLALLIVPIFIAIRTLTAAGKASMEVASLIPLLISIVFIFTLSISQLNYAIVYLTELTLLITPWMVDNKKDFNQPAIV